MRRISNDMFPNIRKLIISCVLRDHPKRTLFLLLRRLKTHCVWGSFGRTEHNGDALLKCRGTEHRWRYFSKNHHREHLGQSIPYDLKMSIRLLCSRHTKSKGCVHTWGPFTPEWITEAKRNSENEWIRKRSKEFSFVHCKPWFDLHPKDTLNDNPFSDTKLRLKFP